MPLGIFTRGKKNAARRQAYNNAKKSWKEQKKEKKRQYKYNVEGLQIAKRNAYANLDFQDASRAQEYNYLVARQKFEYGREIEAFKRSVNQAVKATGFADLAFKQANLQQDRYNFEQEIALDLQEESAALNYRFAAAGLGVQKRKAKASAVSDLRKTGLQGLKAAGEVAARGQAGGSAYKVQQGILAETAAVENDIVRNLMDANLGIDLDLRQLSDQLIMDKTTLDLSRTSLKASDKMRRMAFERDKLQAYLNAQASIMMKPEMGPPIPKPLRLPRPEFQDVFKPDFGIGKPTISQFGQKIGFGEALAGDLFKVGGAVLAGVTAGAAAPAAGALTTAGSGLFGMSAATTIGVGTGLSTFFGSY